MTPGRHVTPWLLAVLALVLAVLLGALIVWVVPRPRPPVEADPTRAVIVEPTRPIAVPPTLTPTPEPTEALLAVTVTPRPTETPRATDTPTPPPTPRPERTAVQRG